MTVFQSFVDRIVVKIGKDEYDNVVAADVVVVIVIKMKDRLFYGGILFSSSENRFSFQKHLMRVACISL